MPGCPTASAPGAFAASVHPETGTAFRAGRPKGRAGTPPRRLARECPLCPFRVRSWRESIGRQRGRRPGEGRVPRCGGGERGARRRGAGRGARSRPGVGDRPEPGPRRRPERLARGAGDDRQRGGGLGGGHRRAGRTGRRGRAGAGRDRGAAAGRGRGGLPRGRRPAGGAGGAAARGGGRRPGHAGPDRAGGGGADPAHTRRVLFGRPGRRGRGPLRTVREGGARPRGPARRPGPAQQRRPRLRPLPCRGDDRGGRGTGRSARPGPGTRHPGAHRHRRLAPGGQPRGGDLREKVCAPGGAGIRRIAALDRHAVRAAVVSALGDAPPGLSPGWAGRHRPAPLTSRLPPPAPARSPAAPSRWVRCPVRVPAAGWAGRRRGTSPGGRRWGAGWPCAGCGR